MKSVSVNLDAHAAGEVLTWCTCWKVVRADGIVFGFTDHDQPLPVSGVTYKALSGHTASSVESTANLSVDNLEVTSFLDDESITEIDLLAGKWNHAVVEIFRVNYLAIADGIMSVRKGHLGEVRVRGKVAVGELRGLTQILQQTIGEVYTPSCRADLFDTRCKLVVSSFTVTGSLTGVTNNATFADSVRSEAAGYFQNGKITWASGVNSGLSMEIKTWTPPTFTLMLPMVNDVASGAAYSATPGCLKRFTTDCTSKYNNAVNFRGEPHVPGLDAVIRRPT